MRSRIIYATLLFSLLVVSCSSQKNLINQDPSPITWESLQIGPKPSGDYCTEMLPDEIDNFENIKREFTSGLAVGFLPEDRSRSRILRRDGEKAIPLTPSGRTDCGV